MPPLFGIAYFIEKIFTLRHSPHRLMVHMFPYALTLDLFKDGIKHVVKREWHVLSAPVRAMFTAHRIVVAANRERRIAPGWVTRQHIQIVVQDSHCR
jgi:hypothetical protein